MKLPKAKHEHDEAATVNRGNVLKATALAKAAHRAWLRSTREIEAPSLFNFQFEEIEGAETEETVREGFKKVKHLIEKAFTRRDLTVQCVSGCHAQEPNAVTICGTGFVRQGIGYDKLNLCFLFYRHGLDKLQDLSTRQIHPREI